jgi:integrase
MERSTVQSCLAAPFTPLITLILLRKQPQLCHGTVSQTSMKRRRMHTYKRPGSDKFWFRIRVPAEVRADLGGRRILIFSGHGQGWGGHLSVMPTIHAYLNFSLQTADDHLAGARARDALGHLEKLFKTYETAPVTATMKDVTGLAGVVYRLLVDLHHHDPGTPETVARFKALNRAAFEGRIEALQPLNPTDIDRDGIIARDLFPGSNLTNAVNGLEAGKFDSALETRFGIFADWVLISHEVRLTVESRQKFLRQVARAAIDAGWQLKRNADGDYSADPNASRFPALDQVTVIRPKVTFANIVAGWRKEAEATGRSTRTRKMYGEAIDRLARYLRHDNPARVTEADIIAFKEARLATVAAKTWTDADLPAIKSVFAWAAANRKIGFDPAAGIGGLRIKRQRVRQPGFTDAEAVAILSAAVAYQPGQKETAKVTAAKRWAPWLAAYSGARISEMLQLRKEDVFEDEGRAVIRITPEAGTVKSGNFRTIPLHPHLLEMGFLSFVETSANGHLFTETATTDGVYARVTQFVRKVVTDPNVQPNHGWRHRFKAVAIKLGLNMRVVDAIQDHAPRTAGEMYGHVDVEMMGNIIDAIPRFHVAAPALLAPPTMRQQSGPSG